MFVAEMPPGGAISGGSVNPNPTTPVNAVSLTFGFFLPGKPVSRYELSWAPPPKIEFLRGGSRRLRDY